MKRNTFSWCVGAGLFASALAGGCSSDDSPKTAQTGTREPRSLVAEYPPRNAGYRTYQTPPAASSPSPTLPLSNPSSPAVQTVAEAPMPQSLHMKADSIPAVPGLPALSPQAGADSSVLQAEVRESERDGPAGATPRRRSYVDTTANPCFSHNAAYTCLVGQLQNSRISKSWRLRFASVDEADPYGGSVTLIEDARLSVLQDGQYVRVTGHFLNPDEKAISPPYQIDSIQAIDHPQ